MTTVRVQQAPATSAVSSKCYSTRHRKLTKRNFHWQQLSVSVLFSFSVLLLQILVTHQSSTGAFSPPPQSSPMQRPFQKSTRSRILPMSCVNSNEGDPSQPQATKTKMKRSLYSFVEARRVARGHGFSTVEEFLDYDCPGAYQVPKTPNEIWSKEFKGWDDFLGLPISTLQEAKDVLRSSPTFRRQRQRKSTSNDDGDNNADILITTKEEYMQLFHDKLLDEDSPEIRLPYRPDLKFKEDWISWDDYLLD
mmetsp:Transcript_810/g.1835  ORF Transcript_810/g.1835 Transcript_810/m.1835 type:complete len:250 (-) Transcript_810:52-801(-)